MKPQQAIAYGSFLASLAVALGALAAHSLQEKIPAADLSTFETGVRYHFYHAIGLLGVGLIGIVFPAKDFKWSYFLFLWGIVLFSGSLYLLSIRSFEGLSFLKWAGPVAPLGGISFIIGWLLLYFKMYKK